MAATIKDISNKTGLGLATVSAYLNGVRVKPKNREAIEKAIVELGYVRNEYARGLKTHRSMTVGVLIPELASPFGTTVISTMEDELRKSGYGVIVCDCKSDASMEEDAIGFLMSKMVDGLIIMPVTGKGDIFEKPLNEKLPVVVIDRMTESKSVSHIVINNREITKTVTERLIKKGHRKIAIINGEVSLYTARERLRGYCDAMKDAGIFDASLIFDGSCTMEGGYCAMKRIVSENIGATAVFATNYDMTIGAIIAVNEQKMTIPDDVTFVGFDNLELVRVIRPKIATVQQPVGEIGVAAAKKILSLMAKKGKTEDIVLKAEILNADSI